MKRFKITSRQSKPAGPLDSFSRKPPASPSRITTALYTHITVSTIQRQEGSSKRSWIYGLENTKLNRAGPLPPRSATRNRIKHRVIPKAETAIRQSHWNGFSALGLEVGRRTQSFGRHCDAKLAGGTSRVQAGAEQPAAPPPRHRGCAARPRRLHVTAVTASVKLAAPS